MFFRAVGRRCAIKIDAWNLPISSEDILNRLSGLGFKVVETNIVHLAMSLVGRSCYQRGARLSDAPAVFDCSGLVKWLYARRGIWIPRRCLHQLAFGTPIDAGSLLDGDLAFQSGFLCPPVHPSVTVACHVGMVIGSAVIHAQPGASGGIACDPLASWCTKASWCGLRRIAPITQGILTLEIPSTLEIETSDDVYWHVLETLDWSLTSHT